MQTSSVKKITLKKPSVKQIIIKLSVAAFFMAFALRFFVIYANIFSAGVSGLVQGISYTMYATWGQSAGFDAVAFENISFWIIYIILNIPLFIFTYKQFGRNFFNYSLYAFTLSAGLGFFLSLTPVIKDLDFFSEASANSEYWVSIIAGTLGGIVYGIGGGMIFSAGACGMGTDPISKYISRKYKKNISLFTVTFSVINSLIWIIITDGINTGWDYTGTDAMNSIFSIRFLATILFLSAYSLAVNYIYPSLRRFEVTVNTSKAIEIQKYLRSINFYRSFTISEVMGGYSKQKRNEVKFIINSEELYELLDVIYEIDEKSFIDVKVIKYIYGLFRQDVPDHLNKR